MEGFRELLSSSCFALFTIIALGVSLGSLRAYGVSLGAAAVFFVALVLGHFRVAVPGAMTELGLVLFVFAVGLQAGPRFFGILRARGVAFLTVGVGSTAIAAGVAMLLAMGLGLSAPLAAGLYAGATTCTPALASALDAVGRVAPNEVDLAAVGYGAAYPFSVITVVVFVQLLPRLLRTPAEKAAAEFRAEELARTPALTERAIRVTNPNCIGRKIGDLQSLHFASAVICRLKHEGRLLPARADAALSADDVVLAVGTKPELDKWETLLGSAVAEPMYDPTGQVTSELIVVSRRDAVGKSFRELCIWERFGVVATRLRRDGIEITPRGDLILEPGDVLRVVGPRDDIAAVAAALGREERRLSETSYVPFAAGIALGAAVGQVPIPLPGGLEMRLGLAGGAFLVALVLGHWGTTGPVRIYVPDAVKQFSRELGLFVFLAGAGAGAGQHFVTIFQQTGPKLLLAGAVITLTAIITAAALMRFLLRWNVLYSAGALCACMTNPPGLAAASGLADVDAAAVGFASVYPVALIAKIILAPLVFLILQR